MKESNNQYPVPSIQIIHASNSSKMDKGRSMLRVLKNPPQPHMCIQDSLVKSSNPCFVNVLSWSKLSSPTNPLDPIPLYGGMKVVNHSTNALQLTVASYTQNGGITQRPDVFAVMAHPEVLRVSGKKCTDVKDRDAFIDLMLDFVEAMNPGIKFKRDFVVLVDRDLAGELKDIWYTVHNKRQREKMNHSCHGEGDLSYFNNKRSPETTMVRISKQATKTMAQLSVQELCAAVDVALIESSNSGSNKPNSWLFHRHFSGDTNSSDNITCCREIDHEESLVGWNNGNDDSGLFNLSMQPLFPDNLNPSLSSSPASEVPSAFPFSEKKTLEDDVQFGQASQPTNPPRVASEEHSPHIYLFQDSAPFSSGSETLVPFDDDEEKSLFGFRADSLERDRPAGAFGGDEEQRNVTLDKSRGAKLSGDGRQEPAAVLHDVNLGMEPTGQEGVVVLCDDKNQEIAANDQPQPNQPFIVFCDATLDQPETLPESTQPTTIVLPCNAVDESPADGESPQTLVVDATATSAKETQKQQASAPMEMSYTFGDVRTTWSGAEGVSGEISLERVAYDHTSDEDKENSGSKHVKKTDRDGYLAGDFETYPISLQQDNHNNNLQDESGSSLEYPLLGNTFTANFLDIKQNEQLVDVASLDMQNEEPSDTSKNPTDLSMVVAMSSESAAVLECTNNALGVVKTDRSTEGAVTVSSGLISPAVDGGTQLGNSRASDLKKSKPLVRSLSQGDCDTLDGTCFAHTITNNFGVQKLNEDNVASQTLPASSKSNLKPARKGSNVKSCKETVPYAGNSGKRPSSGPVGVSDRPKTNTSPARQQSGTNELGGAARNQSAARQRRQGTQNSPPVRPNTVTNATILQSFGVLVPRENAPRRADRKRHGSSAKSPVDATLPPSSTGGEGTIDRSSKKHPAKNVPPADSSKNKPKNSCDKNSRALRRSLCENNKSDASQLLVVGANFNASEVGSVQSTMNSLKNEVSPENKSRKGIGLKARTGGVLDMTKHTPHYSKLKSTKAITNIPLDSDLKSSCSSSQAFVTSKTVNAHIFEEAGTPLLHSEGQMAEVIEKEREELSSRDEEGSTVFVELVPCLDAVALLDESSQCDDRRASREAVPPTERGGSISPEEPSLNGVSKVGDNCPQTKTEFLSHQDTVSPGLGADPLCSDAVGSPRDKSDLQSNS